MRYGEIPPAKKFQNDIRNHLQSKYPQAALSLDPTHDTKKEKIRRRRGTEKGGKGEEKEKFHSVS